MTRVIILHECIDPDDAAGRSYKEVNLEKKHNIPIGSLVEFRGGCRLWVVYHGRDCDGTPLYCMSIDREDTEMPDPMRYPYGWISGFSEDSLTVIKEPE